MGVENDLVIPSRTGNYGANIQTFTIHAVGSNVAPSTSTRVSNTRLRMVNNFLDLLLRESLRQDSDGTMDDNGVLPS